MPRRQHTSVTLALACIVFFTIYYLFSGSSSTTSYPSPGDQVLPVKQVPAAAGTKSEFALDIDAIPAGILEGESIAPKLENATLKYVAP
jgi:hypothetical protein